MEDFHVLSGQLRKMRGQLIDLLDRVDMLDRAGLGSRTSTHKAAIWNLRVDAFRVLVKLFDGGNDVREYAAGFGWTSAHLESEAMRKWLCPEAFPGCEDNLTSPACEDNLTKSEQTPYLSEHHAPIGHEGVWHSKHPPMQLPAYIQNVRNALMRAGHGEQEAHAMAVAAVKRWAAGKGAWGHKGKPTPVVQEAARRAVSEWEELRRNHP